MKTPFMLTGAGIIVIILMMLAKAAPSFVKTAPDFYKTLPLKVPRVMDQKSSNNEK